MRRLIVAFIVALTGCAQQGLPPGGLEEKVPPKLLAVLPESGAVNVHPREVVLKFDEVVSERPAASGASELDQLVLISPRDGPPRVGWHRSTLTIRGRKDFRPNTVYTITVLPGISDLRGNTQKTATTIVFSTGATIPSTRITGVVFDWPAGRPLVNASVEAVAHPDTTVIYVARADSVGHFEIAHLPPGTYTVRGYGDANTNRALDVRELWDSVHVALSDSAQLELLTFVHDTVGPRLLQIATTDSVTLRATFDQPLDPKQALDTNLFTLKTSDSTIVPLRLVQSARAWDSTHLGQPTDTTRRDTTGGRVPQPGVPPVQVRPGADTTKRKQVPTPSRPSPISEVVIVVGKPLTPGATYRLSARDARNLLGYRTSGGKAFSVPKASPPPAAGPARAPADTLRRPR